jgi:hypothetical protein
MSQNISKLFPLFYVVVTLSRSIISPRIENILLQMVDGIFPLGMSVSFKAECGCNPSDCLEIKFPSGIYVILCMSFITNFNFGEFFSRVKTLVEEIDNLVQDTSRIVIEIDNLETVSTVSNDTGKIKKVDRDTVILNYLIDIKRQYNLSDKLLKKIWTYINRLIVTRTFHPIINNGKIESIPEVVRIIKEFSNVEN